MVRWRWSLLFAATLIAGLAWTWTNRVPTGAAGAGLPPAPAIGHPAPDFTLTTTSDEPFTLSSLRGQPVILNFWATWCPPCREEMPELQAASQRLSGQVSVIGVDQGEPAPAVRQFLAANGITFVTPLDPENAVSRSYGVRSIPTTFFIDREGTIRAIQIGPLSAATLAQSLRTIYP